MSGNLNPSEHSPLTPVGWKGRAKLWPGAADGTVRLVNNSGTGSANLVFGLETTAFPMLKRSSATLQVRLGDDSDYADLSVESLITNADDFLIQSASASLADGAAAATGTLTNAPDAGNPEHWIAVDLNGTTAYIPAWEAAA